MIFNKCSCGCTIPKDKIKLTRTSGKNIRTCPYHQDGVIIKRFIYCVDCGAIRYLKGKGFMSGGMTTRCKKCQKIRNNENYKISAKKNRHSKNRYIGKIDKKKRETCERLEKCIDKYIEYNHIPCKSCKIYRKKDFTIDPYIISRDYTERTRLVTHQ